MGFSGDDRRTITVAYYLCTDMESFVCGKRGKIGRDSLSLPRIRLSLPSAIHVDGTNPVTDGGSVSIPNRVFVGGLGWS